ncbi:polysaccharide deacetylase family protein [Candidatus Pelagibacter sp.]|nr:polysaccharide deacetylase family protein [Candidatus Pelagibacter sp.]
MIKKFIIFIICNIFIFSNLSAEEKKFSQVDNGVIALMYHRFDETKYPSTNINMKDFKEHMNIILKKNYSFYNPNDFDFDFFKPKTNKKFLLTIDDAFTSFYENAWPYLKQKKVPFILFVSTQSVGKRGYMTWEQIKEVENSSFGFIGNHSHSHEYLVKYPFEDFKNDIDTSIEILKKNIGYNPIFFSYPFGEYSLLQKQYIAKKFKFGFGQNSGVIDLNKDVFELPRFPINEKYGDLKRFNFLVDLLPLQYKSLLPDDKFITESKNNPPFVKIDFFEEQKNLNNINCYSNNGSDWSKTETVYFNKSLKLNFTEKFNLRRGRINCSLNDEQGWRWLGIQFTFKN